MKEPPSRFNPLLANREVAVVAAVCAVECVGWILAVGGGDRLGLGATGEILSIATAHGAGLGLAAHSLWLMVVVGRRAKASGRSSVLTRAELGLGVFIGMGPLGTLLIATYILRELWI